MWYEVKVAYERQDDDRGLKKVSELYLMNAQCCTEAEMAVVKEVGPRAPRGLEIRSIKEVKIAELLGSPQGGERYYQARLTTAVEGLDGGQPRKYQYTVVVRATDLRDAVDTIHGYEEQTFGSGALIAIKEVPIVEIINAVHVCID